VSSLGGRVVGVDTHGHTYVAADLGSISGVIATLTIATDTAGF
jgi:transposase